MQITKEILKQEAIDFLKILFTLPEIEKICIKDIVIPSLEDNKSIDDAIDLCYHDQYSDIDFVVYLRLYPTDYYGVTPVYKNHLSRLGLEKDKFGIAYVSREDEKEGIRICKSNGVRMDFTCIPICDEKGIPLDDNTSVSKTNKISKMACNDNNEETSSPTWDLEKVDWFWFVSVQALGKLMRKDYLIAAHLANLLVNETLVAQMIARDNEFHTNYHRYGYSERLEYLEIYKDNEIVFANNSDETYNHIAKLLYSAAVSYDKLIPKLNKQYESMLSIFFDIWKSYVKE
jgi:hypothetical protein